MNQKCAAWGCTNDASYEKPLCYQHWKQFESWELDECSRCHYFFDGGGFVSGDVADDPTLKVIEGYPLMCDNCLDLTLIENGKEPIWSARKPERRIIKAHAPIRRPIRHVYILKLSDGTFYVGQTNDLAIRIQEHKDGLQKQTKGKDPRLVFFASHEGMRQEVDQEEMGLTILNSTEKGRRKIRQLIEEFRKYARLIDVDA